MKRYIDANKIKLTGLTFEDINHEVYFGLSDVRKAIEQTPTADVEEVVRCKDCVRRNDKMTDCGLYVCTALVHPQCVSADHFCGYGERKDNE